MKIQLLSCLSFPLLAAAQQPAPPPLAALPQTPAFAYETPDLPRISQEVVTSKPFSVVGPKGTLLGAQDGTYEGWLFPWKIFDNMRIRVDMQDYAVPIDVNAHAAQIDVQPDHTTLTYSHANFTIRQIMLAPKAGDAGVMVFYQFQSVRPMTVTFSFDPVLQLMWPAMSDDRPSAEWVSTEGNSGFYMLHTNFPSPAAAIAMPGAHAGIMAPYQERASSYPLQLVLHFDPKQDSGKMFPLLMAFGATDADAKKEAMHRTLQHMDTEAQRSFEQNQQIYRQFVQSHTELESPDERLNAAFTWAEVSIDQLKIPTLDGKDQALTAGFVGSGDAARPGFGWYFGRDALWTLYAVNSFGGFETTRQELEFLARHQSPEGKIMHERSQTADLVNWKALPYEWASADATALFLMAANDYLHVSGDAAFIKTMWPSLQKAWDFERSHDSNGDGIYDNSEGSAWVESWIPSMPKQEIYMASLDQQASLAFASLARAAGNEQLSAPAEQRAARIGKTIESEYYLPTTKEYAFSWDGPGQIDSTVTIMPAVAWWDGNSGLKQPETMLQHWASSDISTDWGTRILSDHTSFYDPISYHQGTVWPLFTGWVSVAEYRAGHPLAGYAHLMQNANLTWVQDPGNVTELLSGQFYQVLGRSTAHQLWSSAMVLSPILRGMFGLEWDAAAGTLTVTPHLPANWNDATLRRLPFGGKMLDLHFQRQGRELVVTASGDAAVRLRSRASGAHEHGTELRIPLAAVEVFAPENLPEFGSETQGMKVLSEDTQTRSLTLHLQAPAGTTHGMTVRRNDVSGAVSVTGGKLTEGKDGLDSLSVTFPQGNGYVNQSVTLKW